MSRPMPDRIATILLPRRIDRAGVARLEAEIAAVLGGTGPAAAGALILSGASEAFCLGLEADAVEDDTPRRIARALTAARIPTIAALNGPACDAGAEIALACAARVAVPEAAIRLAPLRAGVLPAALGTQTLPRLVPPARAVEMLCEGRAVTPADAPPGLFDRIGPEAFRLASDLLAAGGGATPTLDRPPPAAGALLDATDAARAADPGDPLRRALCDCIEALVLLGPGAGPRMEATLWRDTLALRASHGTRRIAAAEARLRAGAPAPVTRLGVVAQGVQAVPLVREALLAGAHVELVALDRADLAETAGAIAGDLAARAEAGGAAAELARDALSRFGFGEDLAPLASAEAILIAGIDAERLRHEVLAALDALCGDAVPVAICEPPGPEIEVPAARAALVVHPAAGLAEIVTGPVFAAPLAPLGAVAARLGLIPVTATATGIVAQLARASREAVEAMVMLGARPDRIDAQLSAAYGTAPCAPAWEAARHLSGGSILAVMHRKGLELGDAPRLSAGLRRTWEIEQATPDAAAIAEIWLAMTAAAASERLLTDGAAGVEAVDLASLAALGLPRRSGGVLALAEAHGRGQLWSRLDELHERGVADPPPDEIALRPPAPYPLGDPPGLADEDADDHHHQPQHGQHQRPEVPRDEPAQPGA
ncbi:enoyl-CoA hydratase/isomerase family protein [Palleronia sediminis]|nr:enoyl-CoA hydratase/isomerase family protein [Palleronia sediminis]